MQVNAHQVESRCNTFRFLSKRTVTSQAGIISSVKKTIQRNSKFYSIVNFVQINHRLEERIKKKEEKSRNEMKSEQKRRKHAPNWAEIKIIIKKVNKKGLGEEID